MTDRHRRILAQPRRRIHRAGRARVVGLAGRAQRAGSVVGHRAQHPRAPRGAGPGAPAAHLGRPRPDRLRLPAVRRFAARIAPQGHGRCRRSRRGCGAPARSSDLLEHASQELSRASHQIGFALAPANPAVAAAAHRFRRPRRHARARHRRRRRRPDHAQGHRDRRARTSTATLTQAANYINARVRGPDAARGARRPSSSACAKSGCSTTS